MLIWVSAFIFLIWLITALQFIPGVLFKIPFLSRTKHFPLPKIPKISIVFAARNEESRISQALASMLTINYLDYEVIAVNDRSTDATYTAMKAFETNPKLKILNIEELPAGWLGKNHALQRGYEIASGEWLIFTDADIHFAPETLTQVAGFADHEEADHLALLPQMSRGNFLEQVYSFCFGMGFFVFFQPWKVADPQSKNYLGVGAFNMVRRALYEKFGGHQSFRLNVLDDMELGRQAKAAGGRSRVVFAYELISVLWVEGWKGILKSLEKNGFAGVNYNLGFLAVYTVFAIILNVLPFIFLFVSQGIAFYFTLAALGLIFGCYLALQRNNPGTFALYPFHPFGVTLVFMMIWRSAFLALKTGGIRWRDTFYSLKDLRNHLKP